MNFEIETKLRKDLAALHLAGRIGSIWLAGMKASSPDDVPRRASWGLLKYEIPGGIPDGDMRRRPSNDALRHDAVPDLSDPLTVYGLLLLAREAWNDPGIHLAPARYSEEAPPPYAGTISHWHCFSSRRYNPAIESVCSVTGDTEAAAVVAAIAAAVKIFASEL